MSAKSQIDKTEMLTLHIDPMLAFGLELQCRKHGKNRSEVLRAIIDDAIAHQHDPKQPQDDVERVAEAIGKAISQEFFKGGHTKPLKEVPDLKYVLARAAIAAMPSCEIPAVSDAELATEIKRALVEAKDLAAVQLQAEHIAARIKPFLNREIIAPSEADKDKAIELMAYAEWLDCHGTMGGRSKYDCAREAVVMLKALLKEFRITRIESQPA